MPITIYLTGQNNFGNRGCEALVRSTVATLREQLPDAHFFVPSLDIARDSAQWPEAAEQGVEFVPSPVVPASYRWWGRACRVLPFLKGFRWPSLKGLKHLEEYLQASDAVVSIGGDNYSLDYGLVSLFFFVGIAERALQLGKTTALWGASVGPFSEEPSVEKVLTDHLQRLTFVSIRESHSTNYLRSLGLNKNLIPVVDSAFALGLQNTDTSKFWPSETEFGVIGLNMSPLIEETYKKTGKAGSIQQETIKFIEQLLKETRESILLIPHVAPLNGAEFNNDEKYLSVILESIPNAAGRVRIVPSGMNACQLKAIIEKCRFFIGARTHATIAALSRCIPTISIAYSIKARGINLDLFGHERYVLPTPDVDATSLMKCYRILENEESAIKDCLSANLTEWKSKATLSARTLAGLITKAPKSGV